MTSILFLFFFFGASHHKLYLYIYISHLLTTQTKTTGSPHCMLIKPWAFCKKRTAKRRCRSKQHSRKENKTVYSYVQTFITFSSWFSLSHCHTFFFFSALEKLIYKGHCCSFCPTNMYNTYTLYIYIYICQLHKKWGQLAKLTEMEGTNILRRHSWQQTHPQRSVIIIKKTCNSISAAETVTLRQERKEGWCKM